MILRSVKKNRREVGEKFQKKSLGDEEKLLAKNCAKLSRGAICRPSSGPAQCSFRRGYYPPPPKKS